MANLIPLTTGVTQKLVWATATEPYKLLGSTPSRRAVKDRIGKAPCPKSQSTCKPDTAHMNYHQMDPAPQVYAMREVIETAATHSARVRAPLESALGGVFSRTVAGIGRGTATGKWQESCLMSDSQPGLFPPLFLTVSA